MYSSMDALERGVPLRDPEAIEGRGERVYTTFMSGEPIEGDVLKDEHGTLFLEAGEIIGFIEYIDGAWRIPSFANKQAIRLLGAVSNG